MIMDKELQYAEGQTSILGVSKASTNLIDHGARGTAGMELYLLIQVAGAAFAAGTSINFILQTDSAVGFGTVVSLFETGAIAQATLVEGYRVCCVRVPQGLLRYSRVWYEIVGTFNAGGIDAQLVPGPDIDNYETPSYA